MNIASIHLVRSCGLAGALVLAACPSEQPTNTTGDPPGTTTEVPMTGATTTPNAPTTGAPTTGTTSDDTTGDPTDLIPVPEVCEDIPVVGCDETIDNCNRDIDRDQRTFACDNAPMHYNPDQQDLDGDGFGDIIDLCPTVASDNNAADTDRDGIGNGCDLCPKNPKMYHADPSVPLYMRVRNIPSQQDSDRDGVGDACDNCVRVANCHKFGDGDGQTPYVVGMEIDRDDAANCQTDALGDDIGDACAGQMLPGAAGKVGYQDADDFDQDGLINIEDGCPRLPVTRSSCVDDSDCPSGAKCAGTGVCNHADHDGDGVGDQCDTCPDAPNPEQITQAGADDPDGDFIGAACEQSSDCNDWANPRRHAFYNVSVGGRCCVTVHDGSPILDPDGSPIPVDALGPLPAGTIELPPGCEEALKASEDGKAHAIEWCNVDEPGDLYDYFCLLPAWDQDLDAIPDACDLCMHAHDPLNQTYVDSNDKEWPNYGKYCNGDYSASELDPAMMCAPGT